MLSKGRTAFQTLIEDRGASLTLLLSEVPKYLNEIIYEWEKDAESTSEEYYEWDEYSQKDVLRIWHLDAHTEILYDMIEDFKMAMIQRIYSYCEIGLRKLFDYKTTTNRKLNKKKLPGESDISFYKRLVEQKYEIEIPNIENVWTGYRELHDVRVVVTHKELWQNVTFPILEKNIQEILNFLLLVEQQIISAQFE